jgi:transcriptional regulator with XRE-family HTH domain
VKPSDPLLTFGNTLRQTRQARGVSQERLGELAGVHRTYIGAIERGEQNVALRNIVRIARALDTTAGDLLKDVR